jgi:hypothetical protein
MKVKDCYVNQIICPKPEYTSQTRKNYNFQKKVNNNNRYFAKMITNCFFTTKVL